MPKMGRLVGLSGEGKGCGFMMKDGWIEGNPDVHTIYQVNTLRGTFQMSGGELLDAKFLGPVAIKSERCFQVLEGLTDCSDWSCHALTDVLSMSAGGILLMLLGLFLIRTLMVKRRLYRCGLEYHGLGLKGLKFDNAGTRKIVGWKRLLAVSFFCRGLEACSKVSVQKITDLSFTASLFPGEKLCLQNGAIHLRSLRVNFPLSHLYDTGPWKFTQGATWGCASGACPSVEDCAAMNNLTWNEASSQGVAAMERKFCREYPKACGLGRGCWLGRQAVVVSKSKSSKVYQPMSGSVRADIESSLQDCMITHSSEPFVTQIPGTIVRSARGEYYCRHRSQRGAPSFGHLGDIQYLEKGMPLFPWEKLRCKEGWFDDQSCDVPEAFSDRIGEDCIPLPGIVSGMESFYSYRGFAMSPSQPLTITVTCKDPYKVTHVNSSCFEVKTKIWGSRHSGRGLVITATAKSTNMDDSMVLSVNCEEVHKLELPCDGVTRYYPLSEPEVCSNITDETTSLVYLEQYPLDHVKGYDPRDGGDYSSMISGIAGQSLLGLLSGSGLLIVVLVVVICRR